MGRGFEKFFWGLFECVVGDSCFVVVDIVDCSFCYVYLVEVRNGDFGMAGVFESVMSRWGGDDI